MPSTTRGSILISTANDIGEALVDKLGGVGYSPNEWKDKFNLCGIAPIDSAPALSVLSDSAGTGDERGSILIATADAIGAILNKKYNVLRGFKPKEWASACRKMKALEEGSVASASIASFSNGADTVPLTSCVCSIDANLDGKTAVVCSVVDGEEYLYGATVVQGGFNINNGNDYSSTTRLRTNNYIPITSGSYTIENNQSYEYVVYVYDETNAFIDAESIKTWQTYGTPFSISGNRHIRIGWRKSDNSTITADEISGYHCYKVGTKTTKTADLGRAVYGGSADIIKGEGTETYTKVKLSDLTWTKGTAGGREYFNAVISTAETTNTHDIVTNLTYSGMVTVANMSDKSIAKWQQSVRIYDTDISSVSQLLETYGNEYIAYPNRYTTDFTFEPVKIDSFDGVNNIWNDCGNTAVEYYQAPTPYTRKTATGGVSNFSDQRTDLPLTKAIANIAPSIAGKSAVNLVRAGKNLFDKTAITPDSIIGHGTGVISSNASYFVSDYIAVKEGSTIYFTGFNYWYQSYYDENKNLSESIPSNTAKATIPSGVAYLRVSGQNANIDSAQIEIGESASTFEPYQAPTTYTAELGETVYGGSVDFVSGAKSVEYGMITFDGSSDESWLYSDAYGWFYIDNQFGDAYRNNSESDFMICNLGTQSSYAVVTSLPDLHFACTSGTNSRFAFKNSQYSTVEDFKTWLSNNNMIVVYKLATPTESTIPGRVISPIEGVNNYWNDAGGDTEIQYFENEA